MFCGQQEGTISGATRLAVVTAAQVFNRKRIDEAKLSVQEGGSKKIQVGTTATNVGAGY